MISKENYSKVSSEFVRVYEPYLVLFKVGNTKTKLHICINGNQHCLEPDPCQGRFRFLPFPALIRVANYS